jgi:translation initiation factor IF-1
MYGAMPACTHPEEGEYMPKPKADAVQVEGTVIDLLPGTTFTVQLENSHEVLAHLAGKLRLNFIRIIKGEQVMVELSPYDLKRSRIRTRLR